MWTIRPGIAADLPRLGEIERDAYPALAGAGAGWQGDNDTLDPSILLDCIAAGLLFVAAGDSDVPVGFLAAAQYPEGLYVGEIDVARAWQGRGVGRALMRQIIDEARTRGLPALFLTTDRHAPFNAPFYASLGFAELRPAETPQFLRAVLADEIASGANPSRRVAMMLSL